MFNKILLILIVLFGLGPAFAQDTTTIAPKPPKSFLLRDRNWTVDIPIWIPGFRGNFTYGDVSLEGEDGVDPGEPGHPIEPPDPGEPPGGGNIISRLFTSSRYLKFFFMGGASYTRNKFFTEIDMFSGYAGARVHYIDIFYDLNRTERRLDLDFFWTEPLLGLQNRVALKN